MLTQTTLVRQGDRQAVNASTPIVAVAHEDRSVRTFRIYCESAIYFSVEEPSNTSALSATNGAPLPAGQVEFVDVPRGMELRVLGTQADNVYVNRAQKLP